METEAEPTPMDTTTAMDAAKVYPAPMPLLEKLDHMLGTSGCIKSSKEVEEFVKLMQVSQFLVSRCIVLNVIKSTITPSTLNEFVESSGWSILNMWLAEAKKGQNTALLVEILLVLQKLPVTVAALKQGNMGKLIKQLSKAEIPEVKALASDILAKWMAIFKGQPPPPSTLNKPPSPSKLDISSEERRSSASEEDSAKLTKPKKEKMDKKSSSKKKESKSKPAQTPPIESAQLPPGPMVALGKPKDKLAKRLRDPALQKGGQPPPEKKAKGNNGDSKGNNKGLIESEGFMAFLSNQAATKLKEKKVKKPKTTKLSRTNSVTSDTAEQKQEVTTPTTDMPPVGEAEEPEAEVPSEGSLKKKRVSWASDNNLTIVHYFELDESERVNVNRGGSFLAAAQQEKRREREALESGLMFSRDRLVETIAWQRPQPIDIPANEAHPRGQGSEERERQMEREKTVLAQLFLNKSSVQPSPMEPDPEPSIPEQEPKLIPLNEPGAPVNQPMYPPPALPLPPAHGPTGPEPPLMSPGTTINQAQSLINFYEANKGGTGDPNMPRGNGQFPPQPPPPGGYFQGGRGFEPPAMRGGPPGPGEFRGRGFRRRFPPAGLDPKICKHYATHGCRLGANCRFLHCTPEELAKNGPPMRGFRGRGRPWGRGGGAPFNQGPPPPQANFENSPELIESKQTPPTDTSDVKSSPVSTT